MLKIVYGGHEARRKHGDRDMRYPSEETLMAAGLNRENARELRALWAGARSSYDACEERGINTAYLQTTGARVMAVADNMLHGFGVESVGRFSEYPPVEHFCYVNMGDTYDTTILRFPGGRYAVGSWGDAVERLERRGVRVD
jgi:hypothetical protein